MPIEHLELVLIVGGAIVVKTLVGPQAKNQRLLEQFWLLDVYRLDSIAAVALSPEFHCQVRKNVFERLGGAVGWIPADFNHLS